MNDLIENIYKLHTTERGSTRIKRNLSLEAEDVVGWCRLKILDTSAVIERKVSLCGKKNPGIAQ